MNGDAQQVAGLALRLQIAGGHRLAVILGQHRLRIERVHLRRSAIQEQKDDVLGLRREVRRFGRERRRALPLVAPHQVAPNPSMPKPVPMCEDRRVESYVFLNSRN